MNEMISTYKGKQLQSTPYDEVDILLQKITTLSVQDKSIIKRIEYLNINQIDSV